MSTVLTTIVSVSQFQREATWEDSWHYRGMELTAGIPSLCLAVPEMSARCPCSPVWKSFVPTSLAALKLLSPRHTTLETLLLSMTQIALLHQLGEQYSAHSTAQQLKLGTVTAARELTESRYTCLQIMKCAAPTWVRDTLQYVWLDQGISLETIRTWFIIEN